MIRNLISLGIVIMLSAATAGADDTDYHYFYFTEPQPLALDEERIAFLVSDGHNRERSAVLSKAGIDAAKTTPLAVGGWWYATTPLARKGTALRRLAITIGEGEPIQFASPVFADAKGRPVVVTSDIIMGFKEGVSDDSARKVLSTAIPTGTIERPWVSFPRMYRIHSKMRTGFEVLAAANLLAQQKDVEFAEPDFIVTGFGDLIPNDPLFPQLWGIHNTGQNGGTPDMDMDGPEAWDTTIGNANIVTVVIDVGVQQNHPDLNQIPGNDFTGHGTGGGPGNECDNHGTQVAGCISATFNNNIGLVGIAPAAPVASARVGVAIVPCDGTWNGQNAWKVDALNWAQSIGARVTNFSNSSSSPSAAFATAYANTYAAGLVHFASSGNGGADGIGDPVINWPASLAVVNAVGALKRDGNRADFSNWGNGLDFSAPGVSIMTTDRTGNDGSMPGDYVTEDGTSFASPYAAGVAALVLSMNPVLGSAQVEQIMHESCVDLGAVGYDTDFGWGFVSARNSVEKAVLSATWIQFDFSGIETGTFNQPHNTFGEGLAHVVSGTQLNIKHGGTSDWTGTISSAMTINSWQGTATIGE